MVYVIGVALTLAVLIGLSLAALHLGYQAPRIREQGTPGNLDLAYETAHIPTVLGKRLLLPVPEASTSKCHITAYGAWHAPKRHWLNQPAKALCHSLVLRISVVSRAEPLAG
jgi:hypothetical protein